MTDLNSLAERCEKATGPDRELDAEIGAAFNMLQLTHGALDPLSDPEFTGSLDVAMWLVPEGMSAIPFLNEAIEGAWRATSQHGTSFPRLFRERLPLFLCAAALRARSQEGE